MCYRVDDDRLIEINDSFLRVPGVIRNEVSDLVSFQFVSTVKRSEFLGQHRNVHDLGPAIIVTAVPDRETTYRVPKIHEAIRHVVVHTTLSTLLERTGESREDYPGWLQEIFDGRFTKPRQNIPKKVAVRRVVPDRGIITQQILRPNVLYARIFRIGFP